MKTMTGTFVLAALAALCSPVAHAAPSLPASAVSTVPALASAAHAGLGIVVDGRRTGEEGVQVLAVSPGGAGEQMGLMPGDRLLSINGRTLVGVMAPNALIGEVLTDGGEVRLDLVRDGERLALSGKAGDAIGTASVLMEGCGYVSTLGAPPRVTRNIYSAEITQINGRSTPLVAQNRHEVPVGRQVLVVREEIDRHRIPSADLLRIERMQRRKQGRIYKTLVIDVEPDTRYSIGAQLLPDRLDRDSVRNNDWWEPVVWESRREECR
ncbi:MULTISPECIES: PDZ domain-containing protein [unclassified Luteimonas]